MTSFSIEFKGLRELDKALSLLPDEMQAEPVRAGLRAGAKVLQEGMSIRAPRDADVHGVTLAEEIVTKLDVSLERDTAAAFVGPSRRAFYALFLEFGTVKMEARPFIRPTLLEDGQIAIAAVATQLKAGLSRVARRLAKAVGR